MVGSKELGASGVGSKQQAGVSNHHKQGRAPVALRSLWPSCFGEAG